jgi:hypothetical protein
MSDTKTMKVQTIDTETATPWILKKHYAHRLPSISYAFGLFNLGNELTGIVTYGVPANPFLCSGLCGEEHKSLVLELNRLVVDSGIPSFLISHSLKQIPSPRIVVSYADTDMNHVGYVYQATNWIYTGCTKERTDIFSGDGKHARHHLGDKTKRQRRSAKHRYVFFVGSKTQKKSFRERLNYHVLPYPKGQSLKYDASFPIPKQMALI